MTTATLSQEMQFFIYLIERSAEAKDTTANRVLEQWDKLNLTRFIFDLYGIYHIERLENAFADIDRLMAERQSECPFH